MIKITPTQILLILTALAGVLVLWLLYAPQTLPAELCCGAAVVLPLAAIAVGVWMGARA